MKTQVRKILEKLNIVFNPSLHSLPSAYRSIDYSKYENGTDIVLKTETMGIEYLMTGENERTLDKEEIAKAKNKKQLSSKLEKRDYININKIKKIKEDKYLEIKKMMKEGMTLKEISKSKGKGFGIRTVQEYAKLIKEASPLAFESKE